MKLIEEVFNIIAPFECLGCQKEGTLICSGCAKGLSSLPPRCYSCGRLDEVWQTCKACRKGTPIHRLWAVTKYEGLAKELIHRLKFERAGSAATSLARLLAEKCEVTNETIVTFVPTSGARARQRGYDQSALVAKELASRLQCPYVPCLVRIGHQRQVGQARAVRKRQMEGAFRPINQTAFRQKNILLIDDVLTTGATCEAAAHVLRQAGAGRINAAVFAVA